MAPTRTRVSRRDRGRRSRHTRRVQQLELAADGTHNNDHDTDLADDDDTDLDAALLTTA